MSGDRAHWIRLVAFATFAYPPPARCSTRCPLDMQTLPWIIALVVVAALVPLVTVLALRNRALSGKPLPTEWALTARPVFSTDERRVYRQLREALPHHIVLSKLPLVRFCQPNDPQDVRYWYDLLGSTHVTFAICSANGRVLAAIDLDTDRGNSRRIVQIKQSVLSACRVRYLRCPVDNLPSVAELQLLVPSTGASRGPLPAPAHTMPPGRGKRRGWCRRGGRTDDAVAGLESVPGLVLRPRQPERRLRRRASSHAVDAGAVRQAPGATDSAAGSTTTSAASSSTSRATPRRATEPGRRVRCAPQSHPPRPRFAGTHASRRTSCSTRSTPLACAATAACSSSIRTRTGSSRSSSRTAGRRRQVLPPRTLERRADPRGARVRAELAAARGAGRRPAACSRPPARVHACSAIGPTLGCCLPDGVPLPVGASMAIGRAPELDDPDTLRADRPLHRPPARGRRRAAVRHRAALDVDTFGDAARDAAAGQRPDPRRAGDDLGRHVQSRARSGALPDSRRSRRNAAPAWRLPPRQSAVERRAGRISSISTTPAPARRCRTCGCCSTATAPRCAAVGGTGDRLRGHARLRLARGRADRTAAHVAHDPPQRVARPALERPRLPARVSVVRRQRLLGAAGRRSARSGRRDARPAAAQLTSIALTRRT